MRTATKLASRSSAIATPLRRAFSTSPAYVHAPAFDKLGGPAAWRGSELAESEWWGKKLSGGQEADQRAH